MGIRFDLIKDQVEALTYGSHGRMDAQETASFLRQLEFIYAEPYNVMYADIMWRELLPVDTRVPAWADTYTYRSFDHAGEARMVTTYGPDDFPQVDIQGKEITQKIKTIGSSYSYNVQELRQAARMNVQLDAERAKVCRETIERKLDNIACNGETSTGLFGMPGTASSTGINAVTSPTAGSAYFVNDGTHTPVTAQQAVNAINALTSKVYTQTLGKWVADTLAVDTTTYDFLATTPVAISFASEITLLQYVLKQSPYLKTIRPWARLNTAGASSKARVVAYAKDPRVLSMIQSQEFEQTAPQVTGMQYRVFATARTGGVEVRYPDAIAYMDGLQP